MPTTTGFDHGGWWHAAPKGRGQPARRLRALLQALRRWWAKERYRPERRYMRG